jgi:hypothetical protein
MIMETLHHKLLVTDEQIRLFDNLAALRNLAAHGGRDNAISAAAATRFQAIIDPLIRYFDSLRPASDHEDLIPHPHTAS